MFFAFFFEQFFHRSVVVYGDERRGLGHSVPFDCLIFTVVLNLSVILSEAKNLSVSTLFRLTAD